jgi:thiamine pyrophosphate-dependent acetolactate synthase large subunit-like protein
MGARGRTVRTEDELRAALTDRDAAGPRVIDVWIDPQPAPEGYQP